MESSDVFLKIFYDSYQIWSEPYFETAEPKATVRVFLQARNLDEATSIASAYEPDLKKFVSFGIGAFSKTSNSQYDLNEVSGEGLARVRRILSDKSNSLDFISPLTRKGLEDFLKLSS